MMIEHDNGIGQSTCYQAPATPKLNRLPAVSPPTRHNDMNPPAASSSSGSTSSWNPIMQLLPT
jgi:hypothetical protein